MNNIFKIIKIIMAVLIKVCKNEPFYTKDALKKWGERVRVGDYTYGKPKIYHWGEDAKLEIGKYCSIADGVIIFLGGNHRYDCITTYPFPSFNNYWPEACHLNGLPTTNGDVIIGNDVWIGHGVLILSGVRIGDGAVIGAMAVVSKDINPYSIVVGNPAREIKRRFNDETINKLLQIKWWDWPIEEIRKNMDALCRTSCNLIDSSLIKSPEV